MICVFELKALIYLCDTRYLFGVIFLYMFLFLTEDTNDHLPQSSNLAQTNVIHNDLTPVNRNRAATTGVIVNTPAAATNTTTNNINTDSITSTTSTTTNTTTTTDNNSPRLFNNFSNSKQLPQAQSPKVTSPPVVADRPPPGSPAKPKRTSGSHSSVPDSSVVSTQSPRMSSQSPKPAGARGVQFGVVETIPDQEDSYPAEPPPVIPKKPLVPARNSMSPPATSSSSPAVKNIPPSDKGYYVFSPDDDESSSEGDYDEDETVIGEGFIQYLLVVNIFALF